MARKSTRVFLFLTEQQVGQLLETIVTFLVLYVLAITFTILLLLSIGRSRCNASVVPVFSNSSKLTTIDSPETASGKPESFFVKLDCSWVFGTLECKSTTSSTSQIDVINEKSSSEEQKSPKRFNLVLKILCNLYPSQVFRCFVVYTYLLSFVNETFVNSFIICHQSKYQQGRIDQLLEFFNSRSKTIRRARSLQIT